MKFHLQEIRSSYRKLYHTELNHIGICKIHTCTTSQISLLSTHYVHWTCYPKRQWFGNILPLWHSFKIPKYKCPWLKTPSSASEKKALNIEKQLEIIKCFERNGRACSSSQAIDLKESTLWPTRDNALKIIFKIWLGKLHVLQSQWK